MRLTLRVLALTVLRELVVRELVLRAPALLALAARERVVEAARRVDFARRRGRGVGALAVGMRSPSPCLLARAGVCSVCVSLW